MKLVPLDFSGGVNLLRDQRYVGENELVYAKNFVPTKSGLAGKRLPRGLAFLDQFGVYTNAGNTLVQGLYILNIPGADFAYFGRSTSVPTTALLGASAYAAGGLGAATYNVIPTRRPSMIAFDGKHYFVSGVETLNSISLPSGNVAASGVVLQPALSGGLEFASLTFPSTQASAVGPRLATVYRRRAVYADFGAGMEDWFIFSDDQAPTVIMPNVLAANGRNFRLSGTAGRITAIREVMLTATGTPTSSVLVAFKERAMYIIQGEPGQTADTATTPGGDPRTVLGDLSVQRVNTNAGCSSPETIVQTPYGLLWAGPDDVWLLREGQTPARVGTKIRPILEASPADKRHLWHAQYFNGFYRLSLFSEGQGPAETSPCGEQWWLDLRETDEDGNPNFTWWGPMIYKSIAGGTDVSTAELTGVRMQALDTRDGRQPILLSAEYNNRDSSPLYTYDEGSLTGRDGATDAGYNGGSIPLGFDDTEIEVELRTVEADYGDPGAPKGQRGLEVNIASSEAIQLRDEVHYDGGRLVVTIDEAVGQTGFVLDVSALDSALLTRQFKSNTLRPAPTSRPTGLTIQHRLKDRPGYVIDATCNMLGFYIESAAPFTQCNFVAVIPTGFYADMNDLLGAVSLAVQGAFLVARPLPTMEVFLLDNQTSPRTSATVVLTLDTNGSFTLNAWGVWWSTVLVGATPDPVKQKLAALLGFNVTAIDALSGLPLIQISLTDVITADTVVPNKRSAHFELNSLIEHINIFKKRPL